MSFKSTNSNNLKSVVYASEIKTSEYIFDYINGKGQFYVQNKYFPLGIADKKKAFEDKDFESPNGITYHSPVIFFNNQGQYINRFVIYWGDAINDNEWWFGNPFQGYDTINKKPLNILDDSKWSTAKVKSINIPILKTAINDYDKELAKLTFHLNEVLSILLFATIFDINLSENKFINCKNNLEFYKTFIDSINESFSRVGIKTKMGYINEESILNFNNDIYTIKDEIATTELNKFYCYGYKNGDEYLPFETLISVYKDYCSSNRNEIAKMSKINPSFNTVLATLRAPTFSLKNKFSHQIYEKVDPATNIVTDTKISMKMAADFTLLSPKLEISNRAACACTQYIKNEKFLPINNEELLMQFYHKRVTGTLFFSLNYSIGLYKMSSIGLGIKISKFDLDETVSYNNDQDNEIMKIMSIKKKVVSANQSINDNYEDFENPDESFQLE